MKIRLWPRWKRRPFMVLAYLPLILCVIVFEAGKAVAEATAELFDLWRAP